MTMMYIMLIAATVMVYAYDRNMRNDSVCEIFGRKEVIE